MKPPHLAINDEVSKEAVSQLRIFSMQKFRPKGWGFTPSEIFCIRKFTPLPIPSETFSHLSSRYPSCNADYFLRC
ncbi:MAG TPA: hypothetical protein VJH68_00760 [Candidatus Nanoarchaeia archaeon]|nr:hypothetical protein [Candidatus Nanoarchaeia archaeon]